MKNISNNNRASILLSASLAMASTTGHTDLLTFQGQYQSELEERAATSNQAAYNQLKAQGCQDTDRAATASCSGTVFIVWNNVRELVHTANELSNNGPTQFSLDSDLQGLGFALRWTAGEEFSSEESLADSFVSGQLSSLASRVTALRSGARGFNIAGFAPDRNGDLAHNGETSPQQPGFSGLNSGDDTTEAWSRLGGFINGSYTYGDQASTEREDAFDFNGAELSAGIDYRIDDHWVAGFIFGYQQQEIDFDSQQSIVDGGVKMDGLSIMPFVLYQSDDWYYSLSVGYQQGDFETERSIRYPSINPNVDNTDTVAISDNGSDTLSANLAAGYTFRISENFVIEPSITLNYQDVSIDQYREEDINNDGFGFIVDEQKIKSMESVAGLKMQYFFSSDYGVFMPYIDLQFYSQHENDERFIDAVYVNASEQITDDARFSLPTNSSDSKYQIIGVGVAAVLRGARQETFGAAAGGGIQVFVNYRELQGVDNYNQRIISGGLRYEF
ncbi:MAG: outer membrane protein W [Gammaproteobacteria bacterium]|jgi:outer membrane protein W